MKYAAVQQSLEKYIQTNWTATAGVQYDNVPFNSEAYEEYLRLNVIFGEGISRSLIQGYYRQPGIILLSILVRPAVGSSRKLQLATTAADLVRHKVVQPVPPLDAPAVNLKVPSLFSDNKERDGWVMAQVSCPFYYDF